MGVFTADVSAFLPSGDSEEDREPLGTRLRGRADDIDLDPVDAVRETRERI